MTAAKHTGSVPNFRFGAGPVPGLRGDTSLRTRQPVEAERPS